MIDPLAALEPFAKELREIESGLNPGDAPTNFPDHTWLNAVCEDLDLGDLRRLGALYDALKAGRLAVVQSHQS